jgi:UTP--glucose-1-phosphate uridylyltransferase
MRPTTAVIFAAGTGTRMLPITAAVQKELLPIGNRPVIDYIVSDCVAAGITRIIFVIRPGSTGLKDYYRGNEALEQNLRRLGKIKALAELEAIHRQANFEFIEQPAGAGYGTAVPLQVAMPLLDPKETVLVCGGDDFVWHADGASEMSNFITTFEQSGGEGAIMALELERTDLHQYGVIATHTKADRDYLMDLIEKPDPSSGGTALANISKYILNGATREYVLAVKPDPKSGESYITDAVASAAKSHDIVVHHVSGQYLDTGNPQNWLHANQIVANARN